MLFILLILVSFCVSQTSKKTYYDELKISKESSPNDIKKAYFNIVKDCHPDKVKDWDKDEVAKAKYEKYSKIYTVLSDAVKKQRYDELVSFGKYEYDESFFKEADRKEAESQQEKSRTKKKKGEKKEEESRPPPSRESNSSMIYMFLGVAVFIYFIYSTLTKNSTTPNNKVNDKKKNK
jgi:DnaJ-class molecular chaperone